MKKLIKRLLCFHLNWTNRAELFSDFKLLRQSKPWPYGLGVYELRCISCGKIKNFGYEHQELGYFALPKFPINYSYQKDYIDWDRR